MKFTRRGFLSFIPVIGLGSGNNKSTPLFKLPSFDEWNSMSRGDRWNWHLANGNRVPLMGWSGESIFANKDEVESVRVSGCVLEVFIPELQEIHEAQLVNSKRNGSNISWTKGSKTLGELYDDPYWPGFWKVNLDQRTHWKKWFLTRT